MRTYTAVIFYMVFILYTSKQRIYILSRVFGSLSLSLPPSLCIYGIPLSLLGFRCVILIFCAPVPCSDADEKKMSSDTLAYIYFCAHNVQLLHYCDLISVSIPYVSPNTISSSRACTTPPYVLERARVFVFFSG